MLIAANLMEDQETKYKLMELRERLLTLADRNPTHLRVVK
jgi:hypothetical protein